jgi:hypothetical protein
MCYLANSLILPEKQKSNVALQKAFILRLLPQVISHVFIIRIRIYLSRTTPKGCLCIKLYSLRIYLSLDQLRSGAVYKTLKAGLNFKD